MPVVESPFEEVEPGFHPVRAWRTPEEDEAPLSPPRPVNWRRIGYVSLIITGVLLAAYGVWFFTQPRSYHLVAQFTGSDVALFSSQQGYLLREADNTFVLHDWKRGDARWRAVVTMPYTTRVHFSLSPSGRYFAALTSLPTQAHLQLWDNGALSDTQLPPLPRAQVKVLDDGRVFVWTSTQAADAFLLQQGKIIAHGPLLGGFSSFSPDGSAMISLHNFSNIEYASISELHGQFVLANRYFIRDQFSLWQYNGGILDANLFNKGVVLADSGTVYDGSGKRSNGTGWRHEGTAPGGMFTYEHRGTRGRVFSPVSGESWSFPVPGKLLGGDATADGRYALAWYHPRLSPNLRMLLAHLPQLAPLFNLDVLALYERPGRLRAVLRVDVNSWLDQPWDTEDKWWYPSPDGHAIAYNIAGPSSSRCLLFRW